jgi:HlyD family secretion protein
VRLVEPAGVTRISALGVEEQRVDVVVDLDGDTGAWSALGDGYRVDLHVVLFEERDVLLVPTGALFARGGEWAVFVVEAGRAVERRVRLGRRNGLEARVDTGLTAGERVVLYPSELIAPGTLVEAR